MLRSFVCCLLLVRLPPVAVLLAALVLSAVLLQVSSLDLIDQVLQSEWLAPTVALLKQRQYTHRSLAPVHGQL